MKTNFLFYFFNDTATTEIYTLSLHDALPISDDVQRGGPRRHAGTARALQGALREGARREARLHVVLLEGLDRGAEEVPGGERLRRRQRHHLSRVLRHRRRGLHRPRADRADRARRRRQELRGDRERGGRL